jgi:hypothetical protein
MVQWDSLVAKQRLAKGPAGEEIEVLLEGDDVIAERVERLFEGRRQAR